MTEKTLKRVLGMLKAMNSQFGWSPHHDEMYTTVFHAWSDAFAEKVMTEVFKREEWRPAPARLLEVAAQVASPYPDAELCYAEIMHKAQSLGLYGVQDPMNSNSRLPGPPPMSHPVVAQVVAYLGGWEMICTGEAGMQEGLRKQVRAAHLAIADQWITDVGEQLYLPQARRNPRLFPDWKPYRLPAGYVPDIVPSSSLALPPAPHLVPMPDDVRKRLEALGFESVGRPLETKRIVSHASEAEEARRKFLRQQAEELEARQDASQTTERRTLCR